MITRIVIEFHPAEIGVELIEEFAVGFVNSLFDPKDIAEGNWRAITDRAADMLGAVRNAQPGGRSRSESLYGPEHGQTDRGVKNLR